MNNYRMWASFLLLSYIPSFFLPPLSSSEQGGRGGVHPYAPLDPLLYVFWKSKSLQMPLIASLIESCTLDRHTISSDFLRLDVWWKNYPCVCMTTGVRWGVNGHLYTLRTSILCQPRHWYSLHANLGPLVFFTPPRTKVWRIWSNGQQFIRLSWLI